MKSKKGKALKIILAIIVLAGVGIGVMKMRTPGYEKVIMDLEEGINTRNPKLLNEISAKGTSKYSDITSEEMSEELENTKVEMVILGHEKLDIESFNEDGKILAKKVKATDACGVGIRITMKEEKLGYQHTEVKESLLLKVKGKWCFSDATVDDVLEQEEE